MIGTYMDTNEKEVTASTPEPLDFIGAGNGIRTRDPRLGKPMLYQLSYARPVFNLFINLRLIKIKI